MSTPRPRVSWRQRDTRLALRFQKTGDGGCSACPVRGFDLELFFPRPGEGIELRTAGVFGLPPLGIEPSRSSQALQRGEKGTRVDLKHSTRNLFHTAGDAETVHWLEAQGLENEHVEGALN